MRVVALPVCLKPIIRLASLTIGDVNNSYEFL
jgi:hypothetical protein